jgi:hypothetical protein
MNCKNAVKALPEYLDLTLGKDEAVGVRDHLALCPGMQRGSPPVLVQLGNA